MPGTIRLPLLAFVALVLIGCGRRRAYEPRDPPVDGMRFTAQSELVAPGDSLHVHVRVVNGARSARTLEWGACSMSVRVSTVGPGAIRSWDYHAWEKSWNPMPICLLYLVSRELSPGDSVSPGEYMRRISVRRILGDTLPPGRYRVTVRVGANGQSSGNLDGGEVELRHSVR